MKLPCARIAASISGSPPSPRWIFFCMRRRPTLMVRDTANNPSNPAQTKNTGIRRSPLRLPALYGLIAQGQSSHALSPLGGEELESGRSNRGRGDSPVNGRAEGFDEAIQFLFRVVDMHRGTHDIQQAAPLEIEARGELRGDRDVDRLLTQLGF